MKPPSKKLWIALIAVIVIVMVISIVTGKDIDEAEKLADSNVVLINNSHAAIGSVGYSFTRYDGTGESGGTCNADGSLLLRGEKFWLDVRFPCVLTVYADVEGREPLASLVIEEEPPSGEQEQVWYVIARGETENLSITLSLNVAEKGLEKMEGNVSENLGVDVSAGEITYCWYPGHGWQGDGEDFVVMEFSPQDGAALEETLAGCYGWRKGAFPEELKKDTFWSVHSRESLIHWDAVSDSGWFYFRDEKQAENSPQQEGNYRSSDFVAAVYDTAARTLYFFEWHQ